ncbi:MAG TPA: chorismate mutase [Candidatus Glassbacteria bacterium]|nr:chorismate mutase [Candidatus Glassbacteria bacterium]
MEKLNQLREQIDEVDNQILLLLQKRVAVCRAIGLLKKDHNMAVHDSFRENCVYENVKNQADELGLNSKELATIFHQIVNMCIAVQS